MRYGIAIIIIVFLAIVGSVVLLSGGGGDGGSSARVTKLADYDENDSASVSWTVQGRLVGQDQRRAVRITVTRDRRVAEILTDYEERVERSVEFDNSPSAFAAFTRALDNLGFGIERDVSEPDERGVCPLGNRFVYRLSDAAQEVMRTWSDSCANADGPFGGGKTAPSIQQIFRAQITDYNKFVSGVAL